MRSTFIITAAILLAAAMPSHAADRLPDNMPAAGDLAALRAAAQAALETGGPEAPEINTNTALHPKKSAAADKGGSAKANQPRTGAERTDSGISNFFIMQLSLLATVLALHTYTGLHIIRRGIIFSDLVLDQLAAFGIVAGIAFGIKYGSPLSYLAAFAATLIGCVLLAMVRPPRRLLPQEAVIGIMYAAALTACLLLADKLPSGGTDLKNTLQGSMSWVSWPLVTVTSAVYIILIAFHIKFRHIIIGFTDNPQQMDKRRRWDFLFYLSQAVITILIVPVAGVLLAYGFLMIPAAIGLLVSHDWRKSLLAGWSAGMVACSAGLLISYRTDSPYGPSLMLAMASFFLVALIIRILFKKGGKHA